MSLESITKLYELTNFDRRTIKVRLKSIVPIKSGRAHLYESTEVLPMLYGKAEETETDHDLTQERARLTYHQANNEELKEDQLRGALIPEEIVRQYCSGMVVAFRAKMLSLSTKVHNRFTDMPQEVTDEIKHLIHEALTELGTDGLPTEIRQRIQRYNSSSKTASDSDC